MDLMPIWHSLIVNLMVMQREKSSCKSLSFLINDVYLTNNIYKQRTWYLNKHQRTLQTNQKLTNKQLTLETLRCLIWKTLKVTLQVLRLWFERYWSRLIASKWFCNLQGEWWLSRDGRRVKSRPFVTTDLHIHGSFYTACCLRFCSRSSNVH